MNELKTNINELNKTNMNRSLQFELELRKEDKMKQDGKISRNFGNTNIKIQTNMKNKHE